MRISSPVFGVLRRFSVALTCLVPACLIALPGCAPHAQTTQVDNLKAAVDEAKADKKTLDELKDKLKAVGEAAKADKKTLDTSHVPRQPHHHAPDTAHTQLSPAVNPAVATPDSVDTLNSKVDTENGKVEKDYNKIRDALDKLEPSDRDAVRGYVWEMRSLDPPIIRQAMMTYDSLELRDLEAQQGGGRTLLLVAVLLAVGGGALFRLLGSEIRRGDKGVVRKQAEQLAEISGRVATTTNLDELARHLDVVRDCVQPLSERWPQDLKEIDGRLTSIEAEIRTTALAAEKVDIWPIATLISEVEPRLAAQLVEMQRAIGREFQEMRKVAPPSGSAAPAQSPPALPAYQELTASLNRVTECLPAIEAIAANIRRERGGVRSGAGEHDEPVGIGLADFAAETRKLVAEELQRHAQEQDRKLSALLNEMKTHATPSPPPAPPAPKSPIDPKGPTDGSSRVRETAVVPSTTNNWRNDLGTYERALARELAKSNDPAVKRFADSYSRAGGVLITNWESNYGLNTSPDRWPIVLIADLDRALYLSPGTEDLPPFASPLADKALASLKSAQTDRISELKRRGLSRIEAVQGEAVAGRTDMEYGGTVETTDERMDRTFSHIEPGDGGYIWNGKKLRNSRYFRFALPVR